MATEPKKTAAKKAAPAKKTAPAKKAAEAKSRPTEDKEFIFPQEADPRRHVPGGQGVYLDQVQRVNAEIARAKVEGREPNLDNPPAAAGTPLVSKAQFLNAGGSYYPNADSVPTVTQKVIKKD